MEAWQPAIIAAITSVAALGAVWTSTRDLRLRRRMETMDRFLTIAATAHARGRDGDPIGSSEQVPALHLLGELGASEKQLTKAAHASLSETIRWSAPEEQKPPKPPDREEIIKNLRAAKMPEDQITDTQIATIIATITTVQRQPSRTMAEIQRNARVARERLESSEYYQRIERSSRRSTNREPPSHG